MNLIAFVKTVDQVLAFMETAWRRYARMMGTRSLNVAYILVFVVLCSWLLLASLIQTPRIRVQQCRLLQSLNDKRTSSYSNDERLKLYENMTGELDKQGPLFLGDGKTSQSLKLSDLFSVINGKIVPVHKVANPPVRAVVLYLDPDAAHEIKQTIESILSRHFPKTGLWFQDPDLYHFSMHHASHHQNPVPATLEEINSEAAAVRQVAEKSLILEIELERVVLTPSGVLVGCWQVSKGTDPAVIREELRNALPRSPAKQLDYSADAVLEILKGLVSQLNQNLCSKAAVKELWYVEELDLLALALKGRTRIRRFQLQSDPKG
ncbi:uncharacterized protein [Physcomitrium patens]|uniref:uncharacterized protein isoform X3 n=1 Tax=Physcomitrium patens TaxID=3218 RepID=UPI003CCDC1BF